MPQPDQAPLYRPTALDRALASSRTVVTVGPVAGLDVDRIRANLAVVLASATAPRVALKPSADQRLWQYRSDSAEQYVVRRFDVGTDDLGSLVTQIQNRPGPRDSLEMLVSGDYLVADYSHGIGDGHLGLTLLAVLSGDVDPARAATLTAELPARAVWGALLRHYRSQPAAVRDFLRLRRVHKRPGAEQHDARRTIDASQFGKQSLTAYMTADKVTELRTWARASAGTTSTAAVSVTLWMAALHAVGVPVAERVMILVNCRRYLDPKYSGAQGNFAVGIPVVLPQPATPEAIGALIRGVADSGWPLAVLGMAELKAAVKRPPPTVPAGPVEVSDGLRVAVSDLGRPPMFDHTSWVPGRPPQVVAYLEPDGPDAATLLVSELAGVRTFTASFCGAMVDPTLIADALDRMCDDPVGTLLSTAR